MIGFTKHRGERLRNGLFSRFRRLSPTDSSAKAAEATSLDRAREAITYYRPMEDREADRPPLSVTLIRRMLLTRVRTGPGGIGCLS